MSGKIKEKGWDMRRKTILVFSVTAIVIAAGAAAWFVLGSSESPAVAADASNPGFTLTAHDRTMGNSKAPVVLIEYAAPICPHCAAFEMQDFPKLKANYIDTGKVFYVFRVFPLRPDDGPAEKLARCMPEDKYFNFIDLLFRNQPKWDGAEYPVADDHAGLVQVARIAGMTPEQADKCMSDTSSDATINQVSQDAEQKYNITGTPTFIVNGVPTEAGEEWSGLQKILDAALAAKGAAHGS
jgi:protein-disulfide isomerase